MSQAHTPIRRANHTLPSALRLREVSIRRAPAPTSPFIVIGPHAARRTIARCSVLLLCALLLAVAACGAAPPSAATLLKEAQTKFDQTKSFHFTLTAAHLGANDPLAITSASGDVQRPDELSTTATVVTAGFTISEKLIIIGQQQWITNPLTGAWETTNEYGGFATIFDAQNGVGAILVALQHPSTPQSSSSNNVPCWKIAGTISASAVAGVVGSDITSAQSVPTTVCIGQKDSELCSVTLSGPITSTDTPQTTRTFTLSNFDHPVSIQPPQ